MDLYSNNFVNTIETGPLCVSSSKMAYILCVGDVPILTLEVQGQGHNRH